MKPWDWRRYRVRIVQRPEGEAPQWVRDAWIGLELPLLDKAPVTTVGFGVLTGPKSRFMEWWRCLLRRYVVVTGYEVESATAIRLLAEVRPDAADWWKRRTPRFLAPGAVFVFDAPACERLTEVKLPPRASGS